MTRYLLDTSAIIEYLNGDTHAVDVINSLSGEIVSSYACLSELYEGVFRAKNSDQIEQVVVNFFEGLSEVFGVDEDIAKHFGQIRSTLRKQGKMIEDIDILLAATCVAYTLTLVSANKKHFSRVPELKIVEV